jgi:hypothetical protein
MSVQFGEIPGENGRTRPTPAPAQLAMVGKRTEAGMKQLPASKEEASGALQARRETNQPQTGE